MNVQMEEEIRVIESMSFVTKLSWTDAHKDKTEWFRVSLMCYPCREHDICGKTQEKAVQLSRESNTLLAYLQEL